MDSGITVDKLEQMIRSRSLVNGVIHYENSEVGGYITMTPNGTFHCFAVQDEIDTHSLPAAELHLYNHWLKHPMARLATAEDHAIATDFADKQSILLDYQAAGFVLTHTGGGCTAWLLELAQGPCIMITADGDPSIPDSHGELCEAFMYESDQLDDEAPLCIEQGIRADDLLEIFKHQAWQKLRLRK